MVKVKIVKANRVRTAGHDEMNRAFNERRFALSHLPSLPIMTRRALRQPMDYFDLIIDGIDQLIRLIEIKREDDLRAIQECKFIEKQSEIHRRFNEFRN